MSKIIVAIDGYSSCGKSTIAKALARANTANVLSVRELYIVFRPKRFLEVNMRQLRNTIKDYAKYCPSCCR